MPKDSLKEAFLKDLENACKGLVYISETDAEIEPFIGRKARSSTTKGILIAIGKEDEAKIEEVTFDEFFCRLIKKQDWHSVEETKRRRSFAKLKKLLADELSDLKVFRFGKVRIDIYVVGFLPDGTVAGIRTRSVET